MKKAFSMIELIFVIVILGILASVSVPKMVATRSDAQISSLTSDISTILTSVQGYYLSQNTASIVNAIPNLSKSIWVINGSNFVESKLNNGATTPQACVQIAISREDFNTTTNLWDSTLNVNPILISRYVSGGDCNALDRLGLDESNISLKGLGIVW